MGNKYIVTIQIVADTGNLKSNSLKSRFESKLNDFSPVSPEIQIQSRTVIVEEYPKPIPSRTQRFFDAVEVLKLHPLWVIIAEEHERDRYALKPFVWQGPGEYRRVETEDGRDGLVKVVRDAVGREII